jgi:hypothetical protein
MRTPTASKAKTEVSSVVAIAAAEKRIKSVIASIPSYARPASWRIAMEFDEHGDLISFWECSCDENGNEQIGGGIERVGTGPSFAAWCNN